MTDSQRLRLLVVILNYRTPSLTIDCLCSLVGEVQSLSIVNSSVCVFPAHSTHRAFCQTAVSFSLLTLNLAQIASVAYEDIKVDQIELIPQVNIFEPVVHHIEQLLRLELQGSEFSNHVYVNSLATALSIHLIRQYATQPPKQRQFLTGLSHHQLRSVLEYIQAHLDENVTLDAIAQVVGMSRYHFIRRFVFQKQADRWKVAELVFDQQKLAVFSGAPASMSRAMAQTSEQRAADRANAH